jgi:two-component system chemotaxis response regulator CheY
MDTILLVDDSNVMRMIMKRSMRLAGFKETNFIEAANGAEAIEQLAKHPICAVISDFHMPEMDGLEMTRRIRQSDKTLPILLVTAEGSEHKKQEAQNTGVSAYLNKPVTPEELREKLAPLLKP